MITEKNIHWIGAGLASGPGLIALAAETGRLVVWDMTDTRVRDLQAKAPEGVFLPYKALNLEEKTSVEAFKNQIKAGDVIVSMLPAALHVTLANIALEAGAHLITSSYVDKAMAALDGAAKTRGLSFVNEVGLDPGIDHLFAHILVTEARKADVLGKGHAITFVSHCGGVPAEPTDFTYKFSWTPFGVLKALTNPAQCIQGGKERLVGKVWEDVSQLTIAGETFEVYPNRNSLPYIQEYGLADEKNLHTFVRGTLRLAGWRDAWSDIFQQVEKSDTDALKALSEELWAKHRYAEGEKDRVVLYVALEATDSNGDTVWSGSLSLDETGSGWQTAMARTVSLTVAEAVKAVLRGAFAPGVHAAVTDPREAKTWLRGLKASGMHLHAETIDI